MAEVNSLSREKGLHMGYSRLAEQCYPTIRVYKFFLWQLTYKQAARWQDNRKKYKESMKRRSGVFPTLSCRRNKGTTRAGLTATNLRTYKVIKENRTFAHRRHDAITLQLSVKVIEDRWPTLFEVSQVSKYSSCNKVANIAIRKENMNVSILQGLIELSRYHLYLSFRYTTGIKILSPTCFVNCVNLFHIYLISVS